MNRASLDFLYKLLLTPSPTGYEERIQRVVRKRMQEYGEMIETDLHGNLIVGINLKASRRIMLAGHCDQIGFMVRHICKDGFIYVTALGGIDKGILPGTAVTIYTQKEAIPGVIGRKPIHQQTADEREKNKVDIDKVWIDIGAKDRKDAERSVAVGDFVTFKLGVTELKNGLISSPGLDDKVGLFVAMEALRLCARSRLNVGVFAVSTVQEEVGLRGAKTSAFGIDPEVGIAIDVSFATDNPANEDTKSPTLKLGGGPGICRGPNINSVVYRRLIDAAKQHKIPYQPTLAGRPLGNDANAMQVNRSGVATASIEIPNRYMHTAAEVCCLKDLENAAKLIAAFIKEITARTDFRPR